MVLEANTFLYCCTSLYPVWPMSGNPEARVAVESDPYQQMCEQNGRMRKEEQKMKRWREKCNNPTMMWRGSNPRTYFRYFNI
jgi:hypothetical protein